MDRDPRGNELDPVERVSPSTGENDTGDNGDEEARIQRDRHEDGQPGKPDPNVKAPQHDRAPGRGAL
jgi:hypothetical protein